MAIADPASNVINVLLGNGDGTFQSAVGYSVIEPGNLAVFDFNEDGKIDLAAANEHVGTLSVLVGNGDGTFQSVINFAASSSGLAVGDFNGDHASDLVFSTTGNTIAAFLNTGSTFVSTTSSVNPSKLGQAVTFTTTVTPTFSFIGTPSGTVTFKDGNKTLGKVTLSGGKASLTTSSLSVGKHKILTSYSGDSNFNPNQAPVLKQKVIR